MAKAIGSEPLSIDSQPSAHSLKSVLTLRLVLGRSVARRGWA